MKTFIIFIFLVNLKKLNENEMTNDLTNEM